MSDPDVAPARPAAAPRGPSRPGDPARPPSPRARGLPPTPPPPRGPLPYERARERPSARWWRHKREYLREELVAYRRVLVAILVGLIAGVAFMMVYLPRTSTWLLRLFFR